MEQLKSKTYYFFLFCVLLHCLPSASSSDLSDFNDFDARKCGSVCDLSGCPQWKCGDVRTDDGTCGLHAVCNFLDAFRNSYHELKHLIDISTITNINQIQSAIAQLRYHLDKSVTELKNVAKIVEISYNRSEASRCCSSDDGAYSCPQPDCVRVTDNNCLVNFSCVYLGVIHRDSPPGTDFGLINLSRVFSPKGDNRAPPQPRFYLYNMTHQIEEDAPPAALPPVYDELRVIQSLFIEINAEIYNRNDFFSKVQEWPTDEHRTRFDGHFQLSAVRAYCSKLCEEKVNDSECRINIKCLFKSLKM